MEMAGATKIEDSTTIEKDHKDTHEEPLYSEVKNDLGNEGIDASSSIARTNNPTETALKEFDKNEATSKSKYDVSVEGGEIRLRKVNEAENLEVSAIVEGLIMTPTTTIESTLQNQIEIKTSLWRELALSLNEAMDSLFNYNLGNVLKVVNFCLIIVFGLNAMTLYKELEKSKYEWTLMPSVLMGFLILSSFFIFLLNVWIAALPQGALIKKRPEIKTD